MATWSEDMDVGEGPPAIPDGGSDSYRLLVETLHEVECELEAGRRRRVDLRGIRNGFLVTAAGVLVGWWLVAPALDWAAGIVAGWL